MPNWCYNTASLSHEDKTKVDSLIKELEKGKDAKLFNHLYPMPEELRETQAPNDNADQVKALTEKYGYGDWYSWCVNEWGTKWDADINNWEPDDDGKVYISFDTAWAPPIELYEKLVEEGWDVYGTYHEEGMAFVGEFVDGYDNYYEYGDATSDTILEYIPEHLDEEWCISEQMRDREEWEKEDETV